MKANLIQKGHSHASCCTAVTLAAKALLKKIPNTQTEMRKLQLDKEELELLEKVVSKFED